MERWKHFHNEGTKQQNDVNETKAGARSSTTCREGVAMMTCFALESIFASAVVGVEEDRTMSTIHRSASSSVNCDINQTNNNQTTNQIIRTKQA